MDPSLEATVRQDRFKSLSSEQVVQLVHRQFEPEITRLKRVKQNIEGGDALPLGALIRVGVPGKSDRTDLTPSQYLFDQDFSEVNRTITNVLALKWLLADDYDTFILHQPKPVKLSRDTFQEFCVLATQILETPEHLLALIVSLVLGDVGKDPSLVMEVKEKEGKERDEEMNHDTVLERAIELKLIGSSLQLLSPSLQDDVKRGVKLGAKLNIPQLTQGENVPGSLQGLRDLEGHSRAFNLKYLEIMFDVAGAGAHVDARGAIRMIEPVCQSFLLAYDILQRVIRKQITLQEAYNEVLKNRGGILTRQGFRELSTDNPTDRAFLRLCAMGRVADEDMAERFNDAFFGLPRTTREELVNELNISGLDGQPAVILYYMPALFAELLRITRDTSRLEQVEALKSLMAFMTHAYHDSKPHAGNKNPIIECDVSPARGFMQTPDFRNDPHSLEEYVLPQTAS
ncbi:uncharacterized protein BO80DRAFT_352628 [Aspergillus ibericus CBS 121593]|uniref:Uncharacterized protein n=1 Tax=Aspergillus ibericus CBS 121593 TaxID=1448316 RepID=A0A395H2V9_9EURO|nr:hypothetical protein BO80DRAFT_352628 [Aspergillus ibericus CBS 121593]RAL02211.1 hypothetical protein BO80DRAFT_352628 [Aspergillus ibericus CBS 121593]